MTTLTDSATDILTTDLLLLIRDAAIERDNLHFALRIRDLPRTTLREAARAAARVLAEALEGEGAAVAQVCELGVG